MRTSSFPEVGTPVFGQLLGFLFPVGWRSVPLMPRKPRTMAAMGRFQRPAAAPPRQVSVTKIGLQKDKERVDQDRPLLTTKSLLQRFVAAILANPDPNVNRKNRELSS